MPGDGVLPALAGAERWATQSRGRAAATVFAVLVILYAPAASWSQPVNTDVLTNVVTAERLASTGSPVLPPAFEPWTGPPLFGEVAFVTDSERGPISQYPPGAALWGALFYLAAPGDEPVETTLVSESDPSVSTTVPLPPVWPATLAAILSSAVASAALLWSVWSHLRPRAAVAGAMLFGLGTSAWAVAADGLWQHSVTIAAIAIAGAAMSASSAIAGVAFGFAVLARPLTAVIAAVVGLWRLFDGRHWRCFAAIGVGSLGGLGALLAYNRWAFGVGSIAGGYQGVGSVSEGGESAGGAVWSVLSNVVEGFVGPPVGFLLWSPFIVVAAAKLPSAWSRLPDWMRAGALAGLLYVVAHFVLHRAYPDFLPYRYPLEGLFAAAPALMLGLRSAWSAGGRWRFATVVLAASSCVSQALAAFLTFGALG